MSNICYIVKMNTNKLVKIIGGETDSHVVVVFPIFLQLAWF